MRVGECERTGDLLKPKAAGAGIGADCTGVEVYSPVTSRPSNTVLVEMVTEERAERRTHKK